MSKDNAAPPTVKLASLPPSKQRRPRDPELSAMGRIADVLSFLTLDQQRRVINWLAARAQADALARALARAEDSAPSQMIGVEGSQLREKTD